MARTIQSPGVEIKEIDQSLRPVLPAGTNVLVAGFSDQGPSDEVIQVTSQSEFEQIYGMPTTPAERYFYHSVRPLFQSPANIQTYRLPYGTNKGRGFGNKYSALAYPSQAININTANELGANGKAYGAKYSTYTESPSSNLFLIGKPTHFELTEDQYFDILQKRTFEWKDIVTDSFSTSADLGKAAFIALNKSQSVIDEKFQGYYLGAVDNTNLNPATDFDGALSVETVAVSATQTTNYTTLPDARLDFALSSISDNNTSTFGQEDDSVSEVLENLSQFDLENTDFDDTLSFGLFKLRQSPFTPDTIKLDFVLSESFVGTLDFHRQINSPQGGSPVPFFIETKEDFSPNLTLLVNDYISRREDGSTYLDVNGKPTNKVRFTSDSKFGNDSSAKLNIQTLSSAYGVKTTAQAQTLSGVLTNAENDMGPADSLYPLGTFQSQNTKSKDLGSIPQKLDRLFDSVENVDLFDIDLTVDGGMSTINAVSEYLERGTGQKYFDDLAAVSAMDGFYTSDIINNLTTEAKDFRADWKTVFDRYAEFAEKRRKDHMFISDLPRPIFVQGSNFLTLDDPNKNFSLNMLKPIQAHTSIVNTSYAATYAQWVRVYDSVLDNQIYAPFSGFAAASMANTDANFQPWFAPAGFTRGIVTGVNDLSLYPKQKQRDQLYKISVNPVAFFPNEGFVIFGQKTLLKKPSAFDRINVRRLFLNLEKATRQTVKFFIFEPNTLLTRTRVVNTLSPIFDNAKNTEGLYDFLLVCDERNNTPTVIDQNELIVDIYLKPVRAAEFILVNFFATKTGTDFNELVG
jgi:hypothetical protein|tara:strand:+ start:966 stop:3368 length:2403 start_codon:yes stop_codon:yes gene_type:complete